MLNEWNHQRAREAVRKSGKKISWIADQIDVRNEHLSRCLSGKKHPSYELAVRFAIVMGRPVEEFYVLKRPSVAG